MLVNKIVVLIGGFMKEKIDDIVWVFDASQHICLKEKIFGNLYCYRKAIIRDIRRNVKSSCGDYVYPILFDVQFLDDGRISHGHFEVIPT